MSTKVWYKLHKPQELGNVSIPNHRFNDDFDIYDLQEKIHAHHHTEHARNVGNVRVYAAGADPSKDEALDPGSPVPSNTTAPLVVVFVGVWSEVPMAASLSLEDDVQFKRTAESILFVVLLRALRQAASHPLKVPSGASALDELIHANSSRRTGQTFLFHFDEVGLFEELFGVLVGRKMLECIWAAAERLRSRDFFFLSGRSSFLQSVGELGRHKTGVIPSNNLSASSIQAVFKETTETDWIDKEGHLDAMRLLTGGMPQAVASAADYVKRNADALPTDDGLESHVGFCCPHLFHRFDDASFRHLGSLRKR